MRSVHVGAEARSPSLSGGADGLQGSFVGNPRLRRGFRCLRMTGSSGHEWNQRFFGALSVMGQSLRIKMAGSKSNVKIPTSRKGGEKWGAPRCSEHRTHASLGMSKLRDLREQLGGVFGEVGEVENSSGAADAQQGFHHDAVAFDPAVLSGGFDHGVFAGNLISGQ